MHQPHRRLFENTSLRTKFLILVGAVLALLFTIVGLGFVRGQQTDQDLKANRQQQVLLIGGLNLVYTQDRFETEVIQLISSSSTDAVGPVQQGLSDLESAGEDLIVRGLPDTTAQRLRSQIAAIRTATASLIERNARLKTALGSGQPPAVMNAMTVELSRSGRVLNAALVSQQVLMQQLIDQFTSDVNATSAATIRSFRLNRLIIVGLIGLLLLAALGVAWLIVTTVVRPVVRLTATTRRMREQLDFSEQVGISGSDEVGQLASAYNSLLAEIAQAQHERDLQVQKLEASLDEQQRLNQTIQALSVTVIPLFAGTLLVPLVGALTERRQATLVSDVLQLVAQQHATTVVLDLTGLVDPRSDVVAHVLSSLVLGLQLMGATLVLSGIQPATALALADTPALHTVKVVQTVEQALAVLLSRQALDPGYSSM